MKRVAKSPDDIRREAVAIARQYAREREATGDEEGAGEMRDMAKAIARIRLTRDVSQN